MAEPTLYVYVDNSNAWIEGQRMRAVRKGLARDLIEAMNEKVIDYEWSYDFGRLYEVACPEGVPIGRSKLWGLKPPENDPLWARARYEGFEVETFPRNVANRESASTTRSGRP